MTDLISIIVPVYNIEQYLPKCIESIKQQTYRNLEIILVDDGSTDDSGRICDEMALTDERIKVIHKKNGGLADARNAGINAATGGYIGFVDGDDYIDDDMYELLYDAARNTGAEIASCGVYYEDRGDIINKARYSEDTLVLDRTQTYAALFGYPDILGCSCWNKLYVKSVFESMRFKDVHSEDLEFLYRAIDTVKSVICINEVKYHYICREGSTCRRSFNERFMDTLKIFDEMMPFISEKYPDVEKMGYAYQMNWILGLINSACCLEDGKKRRFFLKRLGKKVRRNIKHYWKLPYINFVTQALLLGAALNIYPLTVWGIKKSVKVYHYFKFKGRKTLSLY